MDKVLNKQKVDVDAVSGATNSSKVIKKAIENALIKG
ncbi:MULTISPECIES: FMN-binding protein [unclassified Clostridioides]